MPKLDGSSIKRLRQQKRWTQARLAAWLGTDPVTVSRWERGVSEPRSSARKRLLELVPFPERRRRVRFAADPTTRLREVDRALREQLRLKEAVRLSR
jgi:transcriptional regulator with XRE-family HTH domain